MEHTGFGSRIVHHVNAQSISAVTDTLVQVQHVLGEVEDERYIGVALYQGIPTSRRKGQMEFAMGQEMSSIKKSEPTLVACALNRQRFYLFSRREPADTDDAAVVRVPSTICRCFGLWLHIEDGRSFNVPSAVGSTFAHLRLCLRLPQHLVLIVCHMSVVHDWAADAIQWSRNMLDAGRGTSCV